MAKLGRIALALLVVALVVARAVGALIDDDEKLGSSRRAAKARSPVTHDGWTPLPASGLGGRTNVAVVWTGSEVLVWGGNVGSMFYQHGVAYDPSTGTWHRIRLESRGRSGDVARMDRRALVRRREAQRRDV